MLSLFVDANLKSHYATAFSGGDAFLDIEKMGFNPDGLLMVG
jgi:hypothetical protein